jgi:hypothetical protein
LAKLDVALWAVHGRLPVEGAGHSLARAADLAVELIERLEQVRAAFFDHP